MARLWFGALAGCLALVLALELLCRVLPVSSATRAGYHVDPAILTYAPHHPWRYATGWDLRFPQSLRTNGHGFVSTHEFVRNESAVALIGDSYIESASLDAGDRPAAQLERLLDGKRPVYAMGAAGTSLLDYAERIRWAHEQFGVRDFVLLIERGDVLQSLCGSGNVASACLDPQTLQRRSETRPAATWAKELLRESALAQYLVSQLKLEPRALLRQMFVRSVPTEPGHAAATPNPRPPPALRPEVDAIAAAFFERVRPHVQGRLVLVLDADRSALARGEVPGVDPNRRRFAEIARAAGARVVDTEPAVREHFAGSRLSLDLSPQDAHLNALGVRIVARAAAAELVP